MQSGNAGIMVKTLLWIEAVAVLPLTRSYRPCHRKTVNLPQSQREKHVFGKKATWAQLRQDDRLAIRQRDLKIALHGSGKARDLARLAAFVSRPACICATRSRVLRDQRHAPYITARRSKCRKHCRR